MNLTPLLAPRSIAVVGATDRTDSYAGKCCATWSARGSRVPLGGQPEARRVHGRECVPSVAELPEPVDAVVVAIPAAGVPAVSPRRASGAAAVPS